MSLPVQKAIFNIVTSILIMGGYFFYVFGLHGDENIAKIEELQFWGQFMLAMIGFTMGAKIILYILFAIFRNARHGDEDIDFTDERDKLIEMKSERNGNYIFILGLMGAMIPIAMGHPVQYLFIILISSGFLAGITGDLWKLYYYKRGI